MKADLIPLIIGILVFISSLISLRIGISVAIIEILLGAIAGNFGLKTEEWMIYIANFGGIILTFMAGTEIDTDLMKQKFKESFLIGGFSFLIPFIGIFLFTYFILNWTLNASLISGVALSTTSLAVVYSVLVETNLTKTEIEKKLVKSENEKNVLLDRVEFLEKQMEEIIPEINEMKLLIREFQLLKVPTVIF